MQKIKYLLLTILLMFPAILSAGTYDVEVNKANNLLNKENFVHTYEKYIVHGSDIKFEFSNNVNKTNTSFTKGGFISMDEFNLTKVRNASYLFEGIEFWTLSTNGSNVYAITYNDINTAKSKSSSYSGRATEFVNPTVTVHGEGKLNNPWTFDSIYKVSAKVDTRYATIESGNNAYVKGGCTNAECTARIKIVEKTGNRYIANDCDGLYDDTTKTLTVNNIKRDTVCNVTFGKGLYIVTLNKGTPNKIYLKYGENYYKEFQTKNIIRSIESVEPKTGYTFIGYFYNGHKIINGLKEPNSSDNKKILYESVTGKYITSDVTLEPTWEANKYKVEFDCNGGSVEPQTQIATYDQSFTLTSTVCQRGGYIQTGWNTASDGSGESWTTSNKTNVIWKIPNHVKLYAVWSECPAGTYSPTSSNECILCTVGDYCPKRSPNPTKCPDGYTSETGAININKCYLTISAGKYLGTANTTTQTECAKGTYKESHKVYYGSTSSCDSCPEGYRDGTSIANKTAQSVCLKNVAAGYYIKTANDKTATVCGTGYYSTAHSKTYGQTSSCTNCPEGYRDGTAVGNKTSQSVCLKSVAANKYVKTAKGAEVNCATGYSHTAHNVTYGNVSPECTDVTAPTCTIAVSNKETTSGVTTKVTCSDNGSGCKSNNPTGDTGLKTNKTYTVYDNAGNSGTCSVTVTSYTLYRSRSCSTYDRCAAAGCATYNSCPNSTCGVEHYAECPAEICGSNYVKNNCKTGHNTCSGGYICQGGSYTTSCSQSASWCAGKGGSFTQAGGSLNSTGCCTYCTGTKKWYYCASGENTCTVGWDWVSYKSCENSSCSVLSYNSCPNSSCTCKTYNRAERCGCDTWGNYGPYNQTSCTNTNSNNCDSAIFYK